MSFSINTSLTAMMAFGKKLAVHANNISNIHTEGFRRTRAILNESANGSITVEADRAVPPNPATPKPAESQKPDSQPSDVDLATEIVGTITSQAGHDAYHMTRITPTALLFSPCKEGITHNENEHIELEYTTPAVNVLLHSVLARANR